MPNVHVRCKAQAVSLHGVKGHARTSRSVTLNGKKYSCNGRGKAEMELTSYSSFSGHSKVCMYAHRIQLAKYVIIGILSRVAVSVPTSNEVGLLPKHD